MRHLVLLLALNAAPASKVSIRAEASSAQVSAGEPFSYDVTITVSGSSEDPKYTPPDFDNLEIVRRSTQRGQSFVMNFGSAPKTQTTTTFSYVLQATRPGKARIGPASVRLGEELASTEALSIEVGGSGSAPAPSKAAPVPAGKQGGRTDAVMLRVVPDKFEAAVGEQVVLSLFLLARVEVSDIQSITQPQLEGVLLERDDRPRTNLTPRIQRFGGEEYQVFEIQRYALFALREGKVTVGSFNLEAQGGLGFFSQGRAYKVASDPIDINVKALPPGRPVGFSPMNVGQLDFSVQLIGGNNAQVGKPITLRVVVQGVGNLSKVSLPSPRFGSKLKSYDPETKSEARFEQGQLTGKIQRDYLFVPLEPGEHIVPALSFFSFDPKTGQYRQQTSPTFAIRAGGEATQAPASPQGQAAKNEEKTLHPIRSVSALKDDRPTQVSVALIWAGGSTGLLAALGIMIGRLRKRERSPQEVAKGARAKAERALKSALANPDPRESYAEMNRVVRQYLLERFGISTGTARDRLQSALTALGADDKRVGQLLVELDNCDFARFAPGGHLAKEAAHSKERIAAIVADIDKTKGGRV